MKLTVENLMKRYGYSRAAAEDEVRRATCKHEYARFTGKDGVTGTLCMYTPMGCTRTCVKCRQMTVDPDHCGQISGRRTAAPTTKR